MLNQIVLVGRVKRFYDNIIVLNVPRNYKNSKGEYDIDVIPCTIKGTMLDNTREYININDVVGIKGSINKLDNEEMSINVEKLTFLSSKN